MTLRKSTLFLILALFLWLPIPFLYFGRFDFLAGQPLSMYAVLLFLIGLSFASKALFHFLRTRTSLRAAYIFSFLFLLVGMGAYQFSRLGPSWSCLGNQVYASVANAAGQNCTTTCTDNDLKPCSGWSTCWDKFVSCNAAGKDQDGRNCQGCCFSCNVICEEPEPDPDNPPTITASVSCSQAGSNGWCTGSQTLTLSATDPQGYTLTISGKIGGVPFSCATGTSCVQSLPNGSGTISYTVTASQSGMTANSSTNWKRDAVPPTVSPNVPSPTGPNNWFITLPIAISANGSDVHSGLAVAQVSADGGTWGNNASVNADGLYTVTFRAVDNAGNTSPEITQVIKVDTLPPALSLSTSGRLGDAGWYVSDAVTDISSSDAQSGVDTVEYNQNGAGWQNGSSIRSTDRVNAITVRVYDVAGNVATDSLTVKVDTVSPIITPSLSGTAGSNGWLLSPGTVSAAVNDETSGVNGEVDVSIDGGAWQSPPITLNEGMYSLAFRAYDAAGNEGTVSLTASIDTTQPTVALVYTGKQGSNGWYVSDVGVSAMAADALSGLDIFEVRANGGTWKLLETLSDGVHNVEARVADLAGNANTVSGVLHIDARPPSVSLDSHTANEVVTGIVPIGGTTSDAGSGVGFVEVSFDGGSTWNPTDISGGSWSYEWDSTEIPNGTYPIQVRVTDRAGNVETPESLPLIASNHPPKVQITELWWIWESGEYKVSENTFPISEIKVVISDPQNRWPPVKLTYNPNLATSSVTWDRRFGNVIAPSGDYPVVLTACDIHGNCANARGVIKIPFVAPVPPVATPSPELFVVPTEAVIVTITPTPKPKPAEPTPPLAEEEEVILVPLLESGATREPSWVVLFIALLVLLFGTTALFDPRPKALKSLAKTINLFNKE